MPVVTDSELYPNNLISPAVHSWRRPLLIGGSGQVGAALQAALSTGWANTSLANNPRVIQTSRANSGHHPVLDLAGIFTVEDVSRILDPISPDVILCPGAMTFVDGCEDQPTLAMQINAHGPATLATYANRHRIPFVFFSSDYVFSGAQAHPGPYTESDLPAPLNVYGVSKLEGERAVLTAHPEALVIRTSWVYGPDPAGKNFITFLRRQLAAGQKMRVPNDQVSTPTLNSDLAETTLALLQAGITGVVHVAGPDLISRYELARTVARFFELDESLIEGVDTAGLRQRAPRPLLSGLRSDRIGGWTLPVHLHVLEAGLDATAQKEL